MLKYLSNNKILLLIILIHVFLNFELYCDSFLKIGSRKINYKRISPKGRYIVENYKLCSFMTIITIYDYFSGYVRVYDNKIDKYIYESPVYYGMDCGTLWFQDDMYPKIHNACFETQRLELEE